MYFRYLDIADFVLEPFEVYKDANNNIPVINVRSLHKLTNYLFYKKQVRSSNKEINEFSDKSYVPS